VEEPEVSGAHRREAVGALFFETSLPVARVLYMDLRRILLGSAMLWTVACTQTPANTAVARVDGFHPATVRAVAGSVWVGQYLSSEPRPAWALPARGPVRDLRIAPTGEHGGFAVTFRQGDAAWQGWLDEDLHTMSDLEQVRDGESATLLAGDTTNE